MKYNHKGELLALARGMEMLEEAEWRAHLRRASDAGSLNLLLGAEEWAKLMQVCMNDRMSVAEAADATREFSCMHLASGLMAAQVVQLLERHWHHGKALKEWYHRPR